MHVTCVQSKPCPFVEPSLSPCPCFKERLLFLPLPSPWPRSFRSAMGLLGQQVKGGRSQALVSLSPAPPRAAPHRHDSHNSRASWLPSCRSAPWGPPEGQTSWHSTPPGTLAQGSCPTPPTCQAHPLQMAFSTSERSLLLETGLSWSLRPCEVMAWSSSQQVILSSQVQGPRQGWREGRGNCLGTLGNSGHTPGCLPAYK